MKKSSKYYLMLALALCFFAAHAAESRAEAQSESAQSRDQRAWKEKRMIAAVAADGIQRVEMVGGDYFYDPNYIVVKVNTPVELKVKKTASYIPHNLIARSPEAGIAFKIDLKKDSRTVRFTPSKIGKYPIYCDKSFLWFKTHRERGMEGMIEVVE